MGNNLAAPTDPVTSKITASGYSDEQGIRYAVSGMKGLRATMEDQHLFTNQLVVDGIQQPLTDHSLFAVFDGHGGDFTSKYAAEHFLNVLSKRPEMTTYASLDKMARGDVTGVEVLRTALSNALQDLDDEIRPLQKQMNDAANEASKTAADPTLPIDGKPELQPVPIVEHSGSTCVIVLLTPSHIIGCNCGDSRAILRRAGVVLPLSFDHKPSEVQEKARIIEADGVVKGKRVDGDLAVSRALGDFIYKSDDNLSPEKQKVITKPDFVVYPRTPKEDEFIVLACDGVWDVASNLECADFVQNLLIDGEMDLGIICEEALDTCLERNSKDNMTILVVGLPGMTIPSASSILKNAVFGRRAMGSTRQVKYQGQEKTASPNLGDQAVTDAATQNQNFGVEAPDVNLMPLAPTIVA